MRPRFLTGLAIVTAAATIGLTAAPSAIRGQAGVPTPAAARAGGSCLECHDGRRRTGMRVHLDEWQRSVHGRKGVVCTDCHGGNASAIDGDRAHQAHIGRADPLSATSARNLRQTCGRCHQETASRFDQDPHFAMLQRGERQAPNCVTCHGEVAADPPATATTAAICEQCHARGAPAEHPEYAAGLRLAILEQELSKRVQVEIRAIVEPLPAGAIRDAFMADLDRVAAATRAASISGHGGDDAGAAAQRGRARGAAVELMDRLGQFLTPTPKPHESGVVLPILYVPAGQATVGCGPSARRADLRFVVNDMNGSAVRFADFKDRVVLLNFWATWCGPCKAEIPWLVDLQTKYGAKLQVLGFSVDDPPELLKPYAAQYRINYPLLQGLGHQDVQDAYGPIWGVPMTFLISRDGRVCRTFRGITSKDEIDTAVRSLM